MTAAVWTPVSSCGAHCLRDSGAPAAGPLLRAGRLAALVLVLAYAALLTPLLPLLPTRWRAAVVRGCARNTLRALGIRWRVRGRLPVHHALIVANHVSWLDIVVLLAAGGGRIVAKSEVRAWPVVGRIAGYTGAFF